MTQEQLDDALQFQEESNRRIGEFAVEKGLLTQQQVEEIFLEQKQIDAPFGAIAMQKKLLRRGDLDDLLFSQAVQSTHLGEALMMRGHLTPEQFGRELRQFKEQEQLETVDAFELDPEIKEVAKMLISSFERAYKRFAKQAVKLDLSCCEVDTQQAGFCFELQFDLGESGRIISAFFLSEVLAKEVAAKNIELPEAWRESVASSWRDFFSIVGHYVKKELRVAGQPIRAVTTTEKVLQTRPTLKQGGVIGLRASGETIVLHTRLETASE